jgi:hypothetical protein
MYFVFVHTLQASRQDADNVRDIEWYNRDNKSRRVEILLILIQFEYVTDKLVTESEEILVYFSVFYFIL